MLVIYHANIHTFNPGQPHASAIAIYKDKILAVGDDYSILSNFGQQVNQIDPVLLLDGGGRTIIPGLTDAHIHLEQFALGLSKLNCETPTIEECKTGVADKANKTPQGEWILGHGWNQNNWPEGYGTAQSLDQVAPNHPVYLTAKSLHAAWVNSLALQAAQISLNTPNPPGGEIKRESQGNPTGILFESAMQLVERAIPTPSVEALVQSLRDAQPTLWKMGLTGVHDFDGARCFSALQYLHENNELKLRVIKGIPLIEMDHAIHLGLRSGFGDDWLRIGNIKIFSDGALGPRTAAMLQPYENEPDNDGMLLIDSEELFETGIAAIENGFSLAVHAIGDRANHEVLIALNKLKEYEISLQKRTNDKNRPKLRHRIEHVQIIHPDDSRQLAATGAIASMQPIHATSDMHMADRFWGKRSATSYAWRLLKDLGASLAFGSDAPVESPNPFLGLHAAVTRRRTDGSPGEEGWYPDQRLTVMEALEGYTKGAAYAAGMEDYLGMLAPGYLGDLLVLEDDPFSHQPDSLWNIRPVATLVGGEWVYRDF